LLFSYRRFSFPWYFSAWINGEPHCKALKSQIAALSLLCVMFIVLFLFIRKLLNVVVLFPGIFNFYLQFPWPRWLSK
jgi:hypothetical protein